MIVENLVLDKYIRHTEPPPEDISQLSTLLEKNNLKLPLTKLQIRQTWQRLQDFYYGIQLFRNHFSPQITPPQISIQTHDNPESILWLNQWITNPPTSKPSPETLHYLNSKIERFATHAKQELARIYFPNYNRQFNDLNFQLSQIGPPSPPVTIPISQSAIGYSAELNTIAINGDWLAAVCHYQYQLSLSGIIYSQHSDAFTFSGFEEASHDLYYRYPELVPAHYYSSNPLNQL